MINNMHRSVEQLIFMAEEKLHVKVLSLNEIYIWYVLKVLTVQTLTDIGLKSPVNNS